MLRFTCALISVFVVVNAAPYTSQTSYQSYSAPAPTYSEIVLPAKPSVLYNIPPPSAWNLAPASHSGPALLPVNAYSISGHSKPSPLIGVPSSPSAIAAAASSNVPLNAGSYKLLVVPSYEIPNVVGPEPALPAYHHSHSSGGYGADTSSY